MRESVFVLAMYEEGEGVLVSYWCLTPSQPVRLSQGDRGGGGGS